jgi:hypothetical protein
MRLFLITRRGAYALEVMVVREETPQRALSHVPIDENDLFDSSLEVKELPEFGGAGLVYEASFIE